MKIYLAGNIQAGWPITKRVEISIKRTKNNRLFSFIVIKQYTSHEKAFILHIKK